MSCHAQWEYNYSSWLTPYNPYLGMGVKPFYMSTITSDYPKNLSESGYYSELLKNKGEGIVMDTLYIILIKEIKMYATIIIVW